ncbi:MAG: exonuclease SbcCD subunit D [Lachnospiraceae bacterium]|nr:exonuclease SbcCD subunit D [Lachnospiraceae bacterium]
MKFIHLSDLHLGKRVNEFSMIEDQRYILTKIINIVDEEKPEGVLVAGDVYDRSVPSEEAMQLWDEFLIKLSKRKIPVFAISGNHDSAVRFSSHNKLVENAGIYLSPVYEGEVKPITLEDSEGKLNIYLLPFIKPVHVKQFFSEEKIEDYTDACRVAIKQMKVDEKERNILVAHQFVLGASTCESEEHTVGGLDNVSASVFDCFDYVALGHIHGKQSIGRESVRYSGTPLKYSFSEKNHNKSVTVVEFGKKGDVVIRECPLVPQHDLREIRGTYDEVTSKKNYEGTAVDDYLHIILTDEEDIPDAIGKLRVIYKNIMKLSYDNKRTRENKVISDVEDVEKKTPIELFEEFYELQNNQKMSDEQKNYTVELIDSIWEV